MKNLWSKIWLVMKDVEYLQKDDNVSMPGSGTYKAITEEKVTTEVGKAMRKHGLIIYPIELAERREDQKVVRSSGKDAIDRIATVNVKYRICDPESGEFDIIVSSGTGIDSGDKAIGKAMTYAYKYALLRTFGIPTGEDPDKIASEDVTPSNNRSVSPQSAPKTVSTPKANNPAVITEEQRKALVVRLQSEEDKSRLMDILKGYGYAKSHDIKPEHYDEICKKYDEYGLPFQL